MAAFHTALYQLKKRKSVSKYIQKDKNWTHIKINVWITVSNLGPRLFRGVQNSKAALGIPTPTVHALSNDPPECRRNVYILQMVTPRSVLLYKVTATLTEWSDYHADSDVTLL